MQQIFNVCQLTLKTRVKLKANYIPGKSKFLNGTIDTSVVVSLLRYCPRRKYRCIIRTASVASESRAHINFLRPPTKQLTSRLKLTMYPCLTTVYRAKNISSFANSYYSCAPITFHIGNDVTDSYQVPSRGERYHVKQFECKTLYQYQVGWAHPRLTKIKVKSTLHNADTAQVVAVNEEFWRN